MNKLSFSAISLCSWFILNLNGQVDPIEKGLQAITADAIKAQLGFLASDWTEGRKAGEKGEYLAADYIASLLQLYGVSPGGDYPKTRDLTDSSGKQGRSYFQNFILTRTSPGDEQIMKIKTINNNTLIISNLTYNFDFSMRLPQKSVEIEAPIIFVGYGFKNDKLRYNDFNKLDLKGKFILKIAGTPGFAKALLSSSELSAASREAENIARKSGAVGIIEFNPNSTVVGYQPENEFLNTSPSEKKPSPGRSRTFYSLPEKSYQDNFIRIVVSARTANEILKDSGFSLDDFLKKSESSTQNPLPLIKGKYIYLKLSVKAETVRVRNVIGVVEGTNPDQVIVLGAHYDHLGTFDGYIWNGADDNASGTVGVMTIAKAITETRIKPARTIIFALWTSEEEGLLGSKYYIENLTFPLKNIRLNFNFDMISRYISDDDHKKVAMYYTESCPIFRTFTEENIKKYGIDLDIDFQSSSDPPGGSDHITFVEAGIPILRFKPGHRELYHTPADEINATNWDLMEKIIKLCFANTWALANKDW